ncbi:hypothetical protein NL676_029745 [Syzygium grande]|nr:hypothetical protein NL676_029745 [Syzygium grande]
MKAQYAIRSSALILWIFLELPLWRLFHHLAMLSRAREEASLPPLVASPLRRESGHVIQSSPSRAAQSVTDAQLG